MIKSMNRNNNNYILVKASKKDISRLIQYKKECRFVKHMRHHLMLKGFIAILLFFCC